MKWLLRLLKISPPKYMPNKLSSTNQATKVKPGKKKAPNRLGVTIIETHSVLTADDAIQRLSNQPFDQALFFHDGSHHQLIAKFDKHAGHRFKTRDDSSRRNLTPMVVHNDKRARDRTHVIPIGFHGSENDKRLVVDWDSKLNRGPMNRFEQRVKSLNNRKPIIWFTDIVDQNDGTAIWTATIYDLDGNQLATDAWHDKGLIGFTKY